MFRYVRALLAALTVMLLSVSGLMAQTSDAVIRAKVKNHFEQYQADCDLKTLKVDRTVINRNSRRLDIYLNQNFSYQSMQTCVSLYRRIYDVTVWLSIPPTARLSSSSPTGPGT